MTLFADIDWTSIITNVGLAVAGVIGCALGWKLKLQTSKQKHETALKQLEFDLKVKDAELSEKKFQEEKKQKLADEERAERKARREEAAADKRDNKVIIELNKLIDKLSEEHSRDRNEIHLLRESVQVLSTQLELCKRDHAQAQRLSRIIFEKLGLDYDEEVTKHMRKPPSKSHTPLTAEQLLASIKQAAERDEAENDAP